MKKNIYANIQNFGNTNDEKVNLEIEDPMSYCVNWTIDQQFLHGGNSYSYGQYSKPCQAYLSDYCAEGWDGFCELASQNTNYSYPNQLDSNNSSNGITAGDILIKNTAVKKYMKNMSDTCVQKFEPFDPMVASSPMISYWEPKDSCDSLTCHNKSCKATYAVDPNTIDNDPVMNKILSKPSIALDLLKNIFKSMKRDGTLHTIKYTRIGKFFDIYFSKPEEKHFPIM